MFRSLGSYRNAQLVVILAAVFEELSSRVRIASNNIELLYQDPRDGYVHSTIVNDNPDVENLMAEMDTHLYHQPSMAAHSEAIPASSFNSPPHRGEGHNRRPPKRSIQSENPGVENETMGILHLVRLAHLNGLYYLGRKRPAPGPMLMRSKVFLRMVMIFFGAAVNTTHSTAQKMRRPSVAVLMMHRSSGFP